MRRIIYFIIQIIYIIIQKEGLSIKCKRVRVNEIFMIKVEDRTQL